MMGRLLFGVTLALLAMLCPLSWRIDYAISDPAWFGMFVNNHLGAIRIGTSLGLAGLLAYCAWPRRGRASDGPA